MASVLMVLTLVSPLTFESAVSFVCMQLPRPSPSPGSTSSVKSCIVRSWQIRSLRSMEESSGGRDRRDGEAGGITQALQCPPSSPPVGRGSVVACCDFSGKRDKVT
eukprot:scaffold6859_cov53-Phaeocystis_antarctica.AAC.2